jgi:hypothetical protein
MKTTSNIPTTKSSPYSALARRLKAWRAKRRPGQHIPEELWQAATQLANTHGLSPTSSALKLNYYDLRRRLNGSCQVAQKSPAKAVFVELPAPSNGSTHPTLLELVRPCGSRLCIQLPDTKSLDLLSLVQTLLEK